MKKLFRLFVLLYAVSAAADDYDKWLNEEVKVLITKKEKDAFKKLKADAEKDQFIKDFWLKRDSDPSTPENEFKKEYEGRMAFIKEQIKSQRKAFETDLGQAYLLLLFPYESMVDEETRVQTWVFSKVPKEISEEQLQIAFRPDSGGEFKFADSKKVQEVLERAREYWAQLTERAEQKKAEEEERIRVEKLKEEPPVTTAALKTVFDAVALGNVPSGIPLQIIVDSFMTSGGETFATFAISTTADTSTAQVGLRILNASGEQAKEVEYPFAKEGEPAGYFQKALALASGEYTVLFAISAGDKTGGAKSTLRVPDYNVKFCLSSLILAKQFKQLMEPKPEKEAYTFGKIKVQPSLDHVFSKQDELIIVYEAYNFQSDLASSKPSLEVVYGFQKRNDKPQTTAAVSANCSFVGKRATCPKGYPLTAFPGGDYKLTVTVIDKIKNETATQETTFKVK